MKRCSFLRLLGIVFLGIASPLLTQSLPFKLHSKAAILMEIDSKSILYEKNAFEAFHPASATKLPTALYALKKCEKDYNRYLIADRDTVGSVTKKFTKECNYQYPPHWLVLGGTHIKIHKGEKIRFEDLMYGMLLESANDASNILAKHVGGSVQNFMSDLNTYLKQIGCKNTHFMNPHGLHVPKHYTTAYDMALVACEAVKHPKLAKILKTQKYKIPPTNKSGERLIVNHNKLVMQKSVYYYPYALGGKIGFHDDAKNTIIAAAKKNGKTLVVVLMQCPTSQKKYEDAIKLFEHGFKKLK